MAWKPENDEKPLNMQEFLAIVEKKYPGISRHPYLQAALNQDLYDALESLSPVGARARARLRGYAPPLTQDQHIRVLKTVTGTRTYRRRRNTERLTPREDKVRALVRRNSVYDTNAENAWKAATTAIYKSKDLPLLAAREALQNGVDAIRQAVKKRQIAKGEGVFEVVVSPEGKWMEFRDNGTGMNRNVIKTFLTLNQSGEEKQATVDPGITLTIRRYKRSDDVGAYYFRLNGLFQFKEGKKGGFDAKLPYDYVFDYETPGTTGGFGVAKAVILGASHPEPSFELRTQDLYYDSEMAATDLRGEPSPRVLPERIQGTHLRIKNIGMIAQVSYSVQYHNSRESYLKVEDDRPIEERLLDMLASSDTPDITLMLNGEPVQPYFAGRRGRTVESQYKEQLQGSSGLAGASGYPFNQGRDRFNSYVEEKQFGYFAESVEKEPRIKSTPEDEVYDPGAPEASTRPEDQRKIDAAMNKALSDPQVKRALAVGAETANKVAEAMGKEGLRSALAQQRRAAREGEASSDAPEQPTPAAERVGARAGTALSAELNEDEKQAGKEENAPWYSDESDLVRSETRVRAKRLQLMLEEYNAAADNSDLPTIDWLDYHDVLNQFKETGQTTDPYALSFLYRALTEISKGAVKKGGGGISVVAGLQNAIAALVEGSATEEYVIKEAQAMGGNPNPFGDFAGLYISRTQFLDKHGKYAAAKARRFKDTYADHLPLLIMWDQTLRIIADAAGIHTAFYPGFALNDELLAVFMRLPSGTNMIGVNPFWFKAMKRGYSDAQEVALHIHAMACHELAHMERGLAHGDGHDERFSIIRESLADKSFPVIPGLTALVNKFLGIRIRGGAKATRDDDRRVKELEQQIASGCRACYKTLITALEDGERVDTVDWLKNKGDV